jgi:nicotinate-nucleotide adenylyltransferase
MTTVGLFGGSFNPPHVAHITAAKRALQVVDEIWFVPVLVHPGGKQLARYGDRVAMCELAVRELGPSARVCRVEEELGPCGTLAVVDHLAARHADTHWRLVMGDDIVSTAFTWRGWHELVVRAPPVIMARTPDVSATAIRARLARGDGCSALVAPAVLDYITSRQLYA